MKFRLLITPFLAALLVSSQCFADAPLNLTCAKEAVKNYYMSGQYLKDVNVSVDDAAAYLKSRIEENKQSAQPKKFAMVLDIDDTSLSNFMHNEADDFSTNPQEIAKHYREANAPAISPVLRLYNEAFNAGVDMFFISFRQDDFRSFTETNLQRAGYHNWKALYLPSAEDFKKGPRIYKTAIRKMLVEQEGYDIILNIGDQDTDFDNGAYADHTDKIPNPMYKTTPCDAATQHCTAP